MARREPKMNEQMQLNGGQAIAAGSNARSLLLTLLGEYVRPSGGSVWTSTLVKALDALGVEEAAARQAVARSASSGWLENEKVGRRARWHLSPRARQLLEEGAERIYSFGLDEPAWDGRWVLLLVTVPEAQRLLRHRLRNRLTWAGFVPLAAGAWVSPWPEREAEGANVIEQLGLAAEARSFVGELGQLGDAACLMNRAWDLGSLADSYAEFIDNWKDAAPADAAEAFTALSRLVHEWRGFPLRDPGLPRELLPESWPGGEAARLFKRQHGEWSGPALAWWEGLERVSAS